MIFLLLYLSSKIFKLRNQKINRKIEKSKNRKILTRPP